MLLQLCRLFFRYFFEPAKQHWAGGMGEKEATVQCYCLRLWNPHWVQFDDGPDGKPGGSCSFPGSQSSYIEIPKDDRLDTRYSITLLAMIFPDETEGPIVQFSPPGTYGPHFWVVNSGTTLFFRITRRDDYLATTILLSALLKPRQWFYVGATYDYSTGVVRNWID